MSDIRKLPQAGDRVETGPIQFGDDWPGAFIRGDNAFGFALSLEILLRGVNPEADQFARMNVEALLAILKDSDLRNHPEENWRAKAEVKAHARS